MNEDRLRALLAAAVADVKPPHDQEGPIVRRAFRRTVAVGSVAVLMTMTVIGGAGLAATRLWAADNFQRPPVEQPVATPTRSPATPDRVEPTPGVRGVETPLPDQAAVFAIRAVAAAGLLDPLGYLYTFTSITETPEAWRVGFGGGRCGVWEEPEGRVETCKPLSGRDQLGNPKEDSWLTVSLTDGGWRVDAVEGRFVDSSHETLRGFSLPQVDEDPHWEYPVVRADADGDGGVAEPGGVTIRAASLWVGPIPYDGPGSVCRLIGVDAEGNIVHRDHPRYEAAARQEWQRRGGLMAAGLPADLGIRSARMDCEVYSGRGWQPRRVELAGTESASQQVIVRAELVWEEEGILFAQTRCTAAVSDADGNLMGDDDQSIREFWPPSQLKKGPPYEMELVFTVHVETPSEAEGAEVLCALM
ncbi:MAG TPA: hypothetical protein VNC78_09140 [Actinomycetota bacterium]|nr:hypothetical protein [Actinomycetota bacterium]